MGYEISYLDGTIRTVGKSKFKQLRKREDFESSGHGLRQTPLLRRLMDWLTKMPPADIRNIEKPVCKNLAKVGTSYGDGNEQTRAMIDAGLKIAQDAASYLGPEIPRSAVVLSASSCAVSGDPWADRQAAADWAQAVK